MGGGSSEKRRLEVVSGSTLMISLGMTDRLPTRPAKELRVIAVYYAATVGSPLLLRCTRQLEPLHRNSRTVSRVRLWERKGRRLLDKLPFLDSGVHIDAPRSARCGWPRTKQCAAKYEKRLRNLDMWKSMQKSGLHGFTAPFSCLLQKRRPRNAMHVVSIGAARQLTKRKRTR